MATQPYGGLPDRPGFFQAYVAPTLQFVGGAAQVFVGGVIIVGGTIFPVGPAAWGFGSFVIALGLDDMYHAVAGGPTLKNQAATETARAFGVTDPQTLQHVGTAADIAGGLVGGGFGAKLASGLFRKSAVRGATLSKLDDAAALARKVNGPGGYVSDETMRFIGEAYGTNAARASKPFDHVAELYPLPKNPDIFASVSKIGAKTWQEYEAAVRRLYGAASFSSRQYRAIVDGKIVNGIADNVATIGGKSIAVEAKFVDDWANSLRNPASPIGNRPFAIAEQARMLEQAKAYSKAFAETVYHSNSPDLIHHYNKLFQDSGITNIRFILTQ